MSLFPAGQYKFVQKDKIHGKKSIIFVKLTDSALRTLNEFLKNRDACSKTPAIEFNEETGHIEIPISSEGVWKTETCTTEFKFDVESNMAMQGLKGRFECIKYKCGSKKIQTYGVFMKRLKIHAKDDVFETTKNRMAEAELEQRKVCTKKIDLKLEGINRTRNSKLRSSITSLNEPASSRTPESTSVKHGLQKIIRNRSKNRNIATKFNSPIAKRPLKERLLHILAVKPMKKIELSAALRKDGLRDAEKSLFYATLMSISTVKDNVYHLLRHAWNDVLDDWPFYSEEEKQQVKRNKSQNSGQPSNAVSISLNLSPKLSSLGDWSPSRPGYIKGVDGLPTKRVRISRCPTSNAASIKPEDKNNGDHQILPSRVTTGFDDIIEKFGLSNMAPKISPIKFSSSNDRSEESAVSTKHVSATEINSNAWNKCAKPEINTCSDSVEKQNSNLGDLAEEKCVSAHAEQRNVNFKVLNPEISTCPDTVERQNSNLDIITENKRDSEHVKQKSGDSNVLKNEKCVPTNEEKTDVPVQIPSHDSLLRGCPAGSAEKEIHIKEYVTIETVEQRRQYKDDFVKYYTEYVEIHHPVMQVLGEFDQLKESFRQAERGSSKHSELEQRIIEKYTQLRGTDFNSMRERFDYLHNLLTHIKDLVNKYDNKML